jgi:hypothetical protein
VGGLRLLQPHDTLWIFGSLGLLSAIGATRVWCFWRPALAAFGCSMLNKSAELSIDMTERMD